MNPQEEYQKVYKFRKQLFIDKMKEKYELRITKPFFNFWVEKGKLRGKIADWITEIFK